MIIRCKAIEDIEGEIIIRDFAINDLQDFLLRRDSQ